MPILALKAKRQKYDEHRIMRGYTLLELLVVLALLGLLAALAFPRLQTLYDSFQFALQKQDVYQRISSLGEQAYQQGRGFSLTELPPKSLKQQNEEIPLKLPEGWSLEAKKPIQYLRNGFCNGGKITVYYNSLDIDLLLDPPFCIPTEETP